MIDEATSMLDVAGAIAAALRNLDHDPVVVGGSAATLHAPEAYRSRDVDMVVVGGIDNDAAVIANMAAIGFTFRNGFFFHERSPYTVDFVPSPVAIAGDVISEFATLPTAFGHVRVLRSVDVVKDRLNKYVAYQDPESFEVAVMVARIKKVDLEQIDHFIERQAVGTFADSFHSALARLRARLGLSRRELSSLGFTTAARIRFRSATTEGAAQATARGIQALLDEERDNIDLAIDGVSIRRTPDVPPDERNPSIRRVFIEVSTKRDLAPVDRLALASAVVGYLRGRIELFPELLSIPDDGAPPVATTGF
jgi:hypothetical protein